MTVASSSRPSSVLRAQGKGAEQLLEEETVSKLLPRHRGAQRGGAHAPSRSPASGLCVRSGQRVTLTATRQGPFPRPFLLAQGQGLSSQISGRCTSPPTVAGPLLRHKLVWCEDRRPRRRRFQWVDVRLGRRPRAPGEGSEGVCRRQGAISQREPAVNRVWVVMKTAGNICIYVTS